MGKAHSQHCAPLSKWLGAASLGQDSSALLQNQGRGAQRGWPTSEAGGSVRPATAVSQVNPQRIAISSAFYFSQYPLSPAKRSYLATLFHGQQHPGSASFISKMVTESKRLSVSEAWPCPVVASANTVYQLVSHRTDQGPGGLGASGWTRTRTVTLNSGPSEVLPRRGMVLTQGNPGKVLDQINPCFFSKKMGIQSFPWYRRGR